MILLKIQPCHLLKSRVFCQTPRHLSDCQYKVLGVPRNAEQDQIKEAYYQLCKEYHPDKNPNPGAAARFKEVNIAYKILANPQTRQEYDIARNLETDNHPIKV